MVLDPKVGIGELHKNGWSPTCTKEKHTDVIDSLSGRQLESSLSFVDLL